MVDQTVWVYRVIPNAFRVSHSPTLYSTQASTSAVISSVSYLFEIQSIFPFSVFTGGQHSSHVCCSHVMQFLRSKKFPFLFYLLFFVQLATFLNVKESSMYSWYKSYKGQEQIKDRWTGVILGSPKTWTVNIKYNIRFNRTGEYPWLLFHTDRVIANLRDNSTCQEHVHISVSHIYHIFAGTMVYNTRQLCH